ncbi:unnamed protein product [Prunus armeniaca]
MGKSRTDLPGRDDVRPTPCFGHVIGAKQPRTVRGPTTRPSPHRGHPDLSRLGRNGQNPRSSGPAGKAAERRGTSPTASRGPTRGTPSGAPIRRRPANDRGRPGLEAPGRAKVYQTIPARN